MMTAAMAFFSIAMTLNLTGIRLNNLQLSDLRSSAVYSFPGVARSFLERRMTMASTPIIRYYDHSRLVYEVETKMREMRRTGLGKGQSEENRPKPQDSAPGERREAPEGKQVGLPANSAQPPAQPAASPDFSNSGFMETSLTFQDRSATLAIEACHREPGPAHSCGSAQKIQERSTVWIA
jgi:hypothetical protein